VGCKHHVCKFGFGVNVNRRKVSALRINNNGFLCLKMVLRRNVYYSSLRTVPDQGKKEVSQVEVAKVVSHIDLINA